MADAQTLIRTYLAELNAKLSTGDATEHTHRPALQRLIEELPHPHTPSLLTERGFKDLSGLTVINEPKQMKAGAPDFIIKRGNVVIGYVEAKDIGIDLDKVEKTEQLKRYLPALSNFILTDYLEFRHYIDGKLHYHKSLGTLVDGKIKRLPEHIPAIVEILDRFLSMKAVSVGTPKDLAVRMAKMAHQVRNLIIETLDSESEKGQLHSQLAAFRENLIPDLSHEQFADMYAQTIAYGLFAARCSLPAKKHFTRFDAAQNLPKTNPFLRKLFQHIAGYELDERIAWLVDELAQVLAQADMSAVLKDFGKHTGKEDPVVHFYETFLKEYDPKMREMRGVYYTPEPVVSYIVRSVDHLLKTRFNKPTGLADDSVYILDPAVGTATFLYMIINEIHETVVGAGQKGAWNDYVAKKLLPRLYGFELLMAPYAVAHLKLGLQLQETGYKFETDERVGIYLTNTLEEAAKHAETMFAQWITEEANAAAGVKKDKPIMVVLGNPPYSGISANASTRMVTDPKTYKKRQELTWIGKLIEDYKVVDGQPLNERKHWLQDDYVKFLRFGQWRIDRTGKGILAFITNHGYIDNPTFRGMRQSLLNTFSDVYILNLRGNAKKHEAVPDGGKDENVFDIQQGVAICFMVKEQGKSIPATLHYADLWGQREEKYQTLFEMDINDIDWKELTPNTPFYFFVPREEELRPEYEKGWKITEVFPVNSTGIVTARDNIVLDFDKQQLISRISEFANATLNDNEIRERYFGGKGEGKYLPGDTRGWKLPDARKKLRRDIDLSSRIKPCLYRPFDVRPIFYTRYMVDWARLEVMRHMLAGNNIGICTNRQVNGEFHHILCSRSLVNDCTVSLQTKERTYLFPLYLYPAEDQMMFEAGRRPNLNPEFIKDISGKLGMSFVPEGKGNLETAFGPEDIFNYAYAIFHSPTYRSRYAEFLKIDFPRLPLTTDKRLFRALAEKGAELVALHLMEAPVLNKLITSYPLTGSHKVEKVSYDEELRRVYINKDQYFEGIEPEVWNFQIGGYQVAHKWLKDRKGRALSYDDIIHYQRVVVALTETGRVMEEIDAAVPGWPVE